MPTDTIYPETWEPKDATIGEPSAIFEGTICGMTEFPNPYKPGETKFAITVDRELGDYHEPFIDMTQENVKKYQTIFIGWYALKAKLADWNAASPINFGEHIRVELVGQKETDKGNPAWVWTVDFPNREGDTRAQARRPNFAAVLQTATPEEDTPAVVARTVTDEDPLAGL